MSGGNSPCGGGYSPPSGDVSPYRATGSAGGYDAARAQREQQCRAAVELAVHYLELFAGNRFMTGFVRILESSLPLEKKFQIASAFQNIFHDQTLDDEAVRQDLIKEILTDVYDSRSELYGALNRQSALPLTVNGPAHLLSFYYARTLQNVHLLARNDPARSHIRREESRPRKN